MKNTVIAILLSCSSAFAQNAFKSDINIYDHNYRCVVNTPTYAKWVLDGPKTWYMAPDSTTSEVVTMMEWNIKRQELRVEGFNEIDARYYWNPYTRTTVMLLPYETGRYHVSTSYGTDIR
jgi:hypothetical protein